MPLTEEKILNLVRQWSTRRSELAEGLLSEDFEYVSEIERYGRADFMAGMEVQVPWNDVRILGVLIGVSQAATIFEGVDPTTGLAHRIAWVLDHDGFRIRKMTAIHRML